jgi:RNA polymerase-binding transcription factor DksA
MAKNHKSNAKHAKHAKKPAHKPKHKPMHKPVHKPAHKPAQKAPPKPAAKKAAPAPVRLAPVKAAPNGKPAKSSPTMEKPSKKTALRDSILKRKAATKPIAFSLDEVRAIAQTVTSKTASPFPTKTAKAANHKHPLVAGMEKPKPQHVKAASLADILGFNPKKGKPADPLEKDVPEKFKRYYKLLLDLRTHLTEGIERHSEETLKRSAKDDAGDLSAYGQHMADAGTDTFDRDFALSMVASEQEALSEIDAAIKRIHDGTYGVCEITQKPISKERLLAVPFTRYSAEAQKDLERNRHRTRTQAGLFGELGEEGGKIMEDDSGDE